MKVVKRISIQNLFKLNDCDNDKFLESQKPKYKIGVKSPNGVYKQIVFLVKKHQLPTYKININGNIVIGADEHYIKHNNIWKELKSFPNAEYVGLHDLYDVAINRPHEYITTNGIIHHNTTISKAVCNDLDAEYLYINASDKTSIEVIRNEVKNFAAIKSLEGNPKIVILDEMDSNSNINMQKALRAFIEQFHKSCRFIITCNNIAQIIEPLQSRCEIINFDMCDNKTMEEMKPKIMKRLISILKHKKIDFDESTIIKLIDTYYPDIRYMLKLCQQYSNTYDCINDQIFNTQSIDDEFFNLILKKDYNKTREYLLNRNINYDEMYTLLYKKLIKKMDKENRTAAIHIIAEGNRYIKSVPNKEIELMDTILKLMEEC